MPHRIEYEGHKLGVWLRTQRSAKKGTGGHHAISEGQEAQLQALVDAGQLWWSGSMNNCSECVCCDEGADSLFDSHSDLEKLNAVTAKLLLKVGKRGALDEAPHWQQYHLLIRSGSEMNACR